MLWVPQLHGSPAELFSVTGSKVSVVQQRPFAGSSTAQRYPGDCWSFVICRNSQQNEGTRGTVRTGFQKLMGGRGDREEKLGVDVFQPKAHLSLEVSGVPRGKYRFQLHPGLCQRLCPAPTAGSASEDAQDCPCWDMKGESLLKPAAWDPGGHGDTRHHYPAPCKELGALTPKASHLTLCRPGRHRARRPAPAALGPAWCPPGQAFLQDLAGGISTDQVPTEGITRRHLQRGCNARGAHLKPVAFRSLPQCVAALPHFSRFLFCVCMSGWGDRRENGVGDREHSPVSSLGVPSVVLQVCWPGASAQSCSLLQNCCCPSKSQPA
ncbi:uncharacterized protein LOC113487962 [Athene cunicularia]|uniref:uncharacterized protein LOC113487962 n=1 Tax=Athene cunicularia TaxID=194338 RepID=UPI000EF64482|nr:uncharacterized protein LOC113487962 [Athene cunicularia]